MPDVDLILKALDDSNNETRRRLDAQDRVLDEIRAEAKRTNGEITRLKLWKAQMDGFHAARDGAFRWAYVVIGSAVSAGATAAVVLIAH